MTDDMKLLLDGHLLALLFYVGRGMTIQLIGVKRASS